MIIVKLVIFHLTILLTALFLFMLYYYLHYVSMTSHDMPLHSQLFLLSH